MNKAALKKKLPIIIASALIAIGLISVMLYFVLRYEYPFDGRGTKAQPYLISTNEDLMSFMNMSKDTNSDHKGKYFKLTADINLNGAEWTPVGYGVREFGGNFNGNGHTISNFTIKVIGNSVGFFAYTKNAFSDSGIFNLKLDNVTLTSNQNINNIGVLVGRADSRIENCNVNAVMEISGMPAQVGGIVGYATAEIKNCESNGAMNILAPERIVAGLQEGHKWPDIGGIAGSTYGNIISSSNRMQINMTRVDSYAPMERHHHVGGIVGGAYGQSYSNLTNYADIQAVGALGGVIGAVNASNIKVEKCFNYGDLYSTSDVLLDVGGIVGRSFQDLHPEIRNCYNEGNMAINSLLKPSVNGSQDILSCWVGGIIALGRVNIFNSATVGNINVSGDATHYVGGVVGGLSGIVKNSYNLGNISVESEKCSVITGGIVGVLQDDKNVGVFSCYNAGSIIIRLGNESIILANYLVGGIVGYNMRESNAIQNNYYDSDVSSPPLMPDGFWGSQFWYGEETQGEADNIDSSTIFGNAGVTTSTLQTAGLAGLKAYAGNADDVDAVWVFTVGEYPKLYWQTFS